MSDNVHLQMAHMITGSWISQMIYAAAKLELADRIGGGSRSVAELAVATGSHARSLYRLLRGLASLGVFSEDEPGVFSSTPLAATLRRDSVDSKWAQAVMMGEEHFAAWGDIVESVRTGETAFDRLYGKPIFDYLAEHPEKARLFDAAMTSIHGHETRAMLEAFDLSDIKTFADIGGGNGTNMIGVLNKYPDMNGILFDLPHVTARAEENLKRSGLSDRCRIVGGDFFGSIPGGADVYFMRHIIHDWDDDRSERILRNVAAAAAEGAKLLVVEHVLPKGNEPSFGKLLDINMLLLPGGVERTADEFTRLYESAGFRLTRVVPFSGDLSVVEGVKI